MYHFEFYIIWPGLKWTVQGIDVDCGHLAAVSDRIDLAKQRLHSQLVRVDGQVIIGPLYAYEPMR